jgi:hypothetical protein
MIDIVQPNMVRCVPLAGLCRQVVSRHPNFHVPRPACCDELIRSLEDKTQTNEQCSRFCWVMAGVIVE